MNWREQLKNEYKEWCDKNKSIIYTIPDEGFEFLQSKLDKVMNVVDEERFNEWKECPDCDNNGGYGKLDDCEFCRENNNSIFNRSNKLKQAIMEVVTSK